MVYVYIDCGLGNQMFQYALGTIIAKKIGKKYVKFDTSYLPKNIEGRKTWEIEDIFNTKFPTASYFDIWRKTGNCPLLYRWRVNKEDLSVDTTPKNKNCIYISEPIPRWKVTDKSIDYVKNYEWNINKNYYLRGFWEEINYFEGYEKFIKRVFQFKHKLTENEKIKYEKIFKENSVSVHVRRGDFLKQEKDRKFDLCQKEYYHQAMRIIEERIENPMYVFFTDDSEYVEKEYSAIKNKIIVKGNKDYIDMQLMSCCKHNIIANSTFSFWAAFLNKNTDKIVVVPKTHYLVKTGRWHEILMPIEKTWIQIDNWKSD